jgi:hypothetical protein
MDCALVETPLELELESEGESVTAAAGIPSHSKLYNLLVRSSKRLLICSTKLIGCWYGNDMMDYYLKINLMISIHYLSG